MIYHPGTLQIKQTLQFLVAMGIREGLRSSYCVSCNEVLPGVIFELGCHWSCVSYTRSSIQFIHYSVTDSKQHSEVLLWLHHCCSWLSIWAHNREIFNVVGSLAA